jgi:hypothetical protein
MSRRTLGGGRVLGTPGALSSVPSPQPKPRVLSPTASSVSLSSQTSVSQFSSATQDLTSRISLENGDTSISAAPAAPGALLTCPICNEEMVCFVAPIRVLILGKLCLFASGNPTTAKQVPRNPCPPHASPQRSLTIRQAPRRHPPKPRGR